MKNYIFYSNYSKNEIQNYLNGLLQEVNLCLKDININYLSSDIEIANCRLLIYINNDFNNEKFQNLLKDKFNYLNSINLQNQFDIEYFILKQNELNFIEQINPGLLIQYNKIEIDYQEAKLNGEDIENNFEFLFDFEEFKNLLYKSMLKNNILVYCIN